MKIAITLILTNNICLAPHHESHQLKSSVNENRTVFGAFFMFCISLIYEHTTVQLSFLYLKKKG